MSVANATKAQMEALHKALVQLEQETRFYNQGLNPKKNVAAYVTAVNTLVDTVVTTATAVKNA